VRNGNASLVQHFEKVSIAQRYVRYQRTHNSMISARFEPMILLTNNNVPSRYGDFVEVV
jgi:hypothetical protein